MMSLDLSGTVIGLGTIQSIPIMSRPGHGRGPPGFA